ncbi:MAG: hypothetical protein MMC33_005093 [Icmadophila ericetorum]|nr:hypothetical protein [Icmadophila ericetorum]
MFSPDATILVGSSGRNPRRRQRTASDDSIVLRENPKRRKRSKLAPDTFEEPEATKQNGHARKSKAHAGSTSNGVDHRAQHDAGADTASLVIRNKGKKRTDRDSKNTEDGIVLTKNDNYLITHAPGIPEELRDIVGTERWHAALSPHLGYAVALTRTQAIVWRYKQTNAPGDSSRPLVVKLPYPSDDVRSPLPLGAVVHDTGVGELALLVIMPNSGKVTYWENILLAASMDLVRQKPQGLYGVVNGLQSSEKISNVTEAEPDGFLLTFSTGRVAHLAIRDPQGRPLITTQYLPGNGSPSSGLLSLRGLRNVLGVGWRREIAAVKSGPLSGKSRRICIAATAKGSFQIWDLIRHSTKTLRFEVDAKEEMSRYIRDACPEVTDFAPDAFNVLDFTFFPTAKGRGDEMENHRLLVLTACIGETFTRYVLLDTVIRDKSLDVEIVHPILCYSEKEAVTNIRKPQVLLPEPAHTAFVVFSRSITMVSLAMIEQTPSSQLQIESHSLPDPFQDTLYFRKEPDYYVVGCDVALQDRETENASCVLFVHGFGLVQVTALQVGGGLSTTARAAVTAKTKIEQAIFFGSMPQNLLDLSRRSEFTFDIEEIEAAALEVNDSIMKSTSDYIPAMAPSMEHLLKLRATALADLIKYLQRFQYPLKKLSRWKLLWSAEKMAAARALWKVHNANIGNLSLDEKSSTSLLVELFDMLSEELKVENHPSRGETDIVRHYLMHDIWRIESVIPWAEKAVREIYRELKEGLVSTTENVKGLDATAQATIVSQADDITISMLEAAFGFRSMNAALYGIDPNNLEDGVLQDGYEDLPEVWTSTRATVLNVKELTDLSRQTVIYFSEETSEGELDIEILKKLAIDNPRLVRLCCQIYEERSRWLRAQPDPSMKAKGESLLQKYLKDRKDLIVKIAELEIPAEGVKLAEKYQDMQALADILYADTGLITERMSVVGLSESEEEELEVRLKNNTRKMETYFTTYGTNWANAFYSKQVNEGRLDDLFDSCGSPAQDSLTQYLRSHKEYTKFGWINEAIGEHNYAKTASDLTEAQKTENRLWNKKIELSISKLALLAAEEQQQIINDEQLRQNRRVERQMNIVDIQQQLYQYIRPTIQNAIDDAAELQLAVDAFCKPLKGRPTLRKAMERILKKLIAWDVVSAEDMIDMLTLLDLTKPNSEDTDIPDLRFFHALKLLSYLRLESKDAGRDELLEKCIWRRCIILENWEDLNKTELKNDKEVDVKLQATAVFRTLKAGFADGLFNTLPPPLPQSLHGAGTTLSSLLSSKNYSQSSEPHLDALAKELSTEDALLEKALDKGRLGLWWAGLVETARRANTKKAKFSSQSYPTSKKKDGKSTKDKENSTHGHSTRASVSHQSSAQPPPAASASSSLSVPQPEMNGALDAGGTPIPVKRKREERGEGMVLRNDGERRRAAAVVATVNRVDGAAAAAAAGQPSTVTVRLDGEGDVFMDS